MNFNKYFEYAKQKGFSDVEFKVSKSNSLSIGVFQRKVESYTVAENETIAIRALKDGKLVTGTTEKLTDIFLTLDGMADLANYIEEKKPVDFYEGSEKYARKKKSEDKLSCVDNQTKIDWLLDLENKAYEYSPKISAVERASYRETTTSLKLVNSKGLNLSYSTTYGFVMMFVVAKSETDTRTGGQFKSFSSLESVDKNDIVKEACDSAIKALDGNQCASRKYKTLLANDVAAELLGFFLTNVSGEAKNKGKTLLKDKLNESVASSKLTITEDPNTAKYPFFARNFDDEGVATYKKDIIKNGVLKTFLYDIEAAKVAGVAPTGNGYGKRGPISVDTNFLEVKPGKLDKDGLAAKIKDGIYLTSLQGTHAGLNALSGDFSLQCSGYLIENGKITTPVNLITVAGNLFQLVKDIVAVGSDSELSYSGMLCPSMYIKKLAISGK